MRSVIFGALTGLGLSAVVLSVASLVTSQSPFAAPQPDPSTAVAPSGPVAGQADSSPNVPASTAPVVGERATVTSGLPAPSGDSTPPVVAPPARVAAGSEVSVPQAPEAGGAIEAPHAESGPVLSGAPSAPAAGDADIGPSVAGQGPRVEPLETALANQNLGPAQAGAALPQGEAAPQIPGSLALQPETAPGTLPIQPSRPVRPDVRNLQTTLPANVGPSGAPLPELPGPSAQEPERVQVALLPQAEGVSDTPPVVISNPPPAPGVAAAPIVEQDEQYQPAVPTESVRPGFGSGVAPIAPPSRDNDSDVDTADNGGSAPNRPVVRQLPGSPSTGFNRELPTVRVNRLPTINNGGSSALPGPSNANAGGAAPADDGALVRFAASFPDPRNVPLLGVVLFDDPDTGVDAARLAGLPFPVSVAIDPSAPNASARAQELRRLGIEVLIVATLQGVFRPTDVEVAFEAYQTALPEAVAMIELPGGSMPQERQAERQLVTALSASGHGLVTFPEGLNAIQRLAEREGVAATMVAGSIRGETRLTATRILDRALFRAGRDGGAIIVGGTDDATLRVLTDWAGDQRSDALAVGPASAVLMRL